MDGSWFWEEKRENQGSQKISLQDPMRGSCTECSATISCKLRNFEKREVHSPEDVLFCFVSCMSLNLLIIWYFRREIQESLTVIQYCRTNFCLRHVNSVYLLTCHGQPPNGAFLPPTILVSGLGNKGGTPHSVSSKNTS